MSYVTLRYVERVTEDIIKLLSQSDKMAATGRLMILKREEAAEEEKVTKPKISLVKEKTLELKRLVCLVLLVYYSMYSMYY